jgi:restriction system protein
MAIPHQEEMLRPVLAALGDGLDHSSDDIRRAISEHFGLTDEEVKRPRPSGVGTVFANTVDWALVDLQLKGPSPWLIEKVKDKVYRITDRGKYMLAQHETFDDEALAG